jgi:ABC-type phosphate transport system permease subunit
MSSRVQRGETYVWLSGAALTGILLIAITLIVVVLANGLGHLWPAPVVEVEVKSDWQIAVETLQSEVAKRDAETEEEEAAAAAGDGGQAGEPEAVSVPLGSLPPPVAAKGLPAGLRHRGGQLSYTGDGPITDAMLAEWKAMYPGGTRKMMGRITDRQARRDGEGEEIQFKVANRDLYSSDFLWINASDIVDGSWTEPDDAIVLERRENGNFIGRPIQVVTPTLPVELTGDVWADLEAAQEAMSGPASEVDAMQAEAGRLARELNRLDSNVRTIEEYHLAKKTEARGVMIRDAEIYGTAMPPRGLMALVHRVEELRTALKDARVEHLRKGLAFADLPSPGEEEGPGPQIAAIAAGIWNVRSGIEQLAQRLKGSEDGSGAGASMPATVDETVDKLEASIKRFRKRFDEALAKLGDAAGEAGDAATAGDQLGEALDELKSAIEDAGTPAEWTDDARTAIGYATSRLEVALAGVKAATIAIDVQAARKERDKAIAAAEAEGKPFPPKMADLTAEIERYQVELIDASLAKAEKLYASEKVQGAANRELAVLNENLLVVADSNGQRISVQLPGIVRDTRPNTMSVGDKLGYYFDRVAEILTEDPRDNNMEGGLFPAIFGTVMLIFIMAITSFPLGVLAGIYLGEYAKEGTLVRMVRIAVNNLAGIPSIVYGIFGLGFFVYGIGGSIDEIFFPHRVAAGEPLFGTGGILWASLTLGLLTVPVVIVSTEEALRTIPSGIKQGSYALGSTKFQTLIRVLLPRPRPAS